MFANSRTLITIFSDVDTEFTTADTEIWWPEFMLYRDLTHHIAINSYNPRRKKKRNYRME